MAEFGKILELNYYDHVINHSRLYKGFQNLKSSFEIFQENGKEKKRRNSGLC